MVKAEPEVVEIADICAVLERLARADVLDSHSNKACMRGAYLLIKFRELVFTGHSDKEIAESLRELLQKNQEG